MLVNSIKLLKQLRNSKKCIPAFNVYNMETIQAAFEAAASAKKPVIISFGESYLNNASLEVIACMVKAISDKHPYPVILHLDHCRDLNTIKAAIEAGFTSVMYDGSQLQLEENIKNTRDVVQYAHARGVSVEGELGCMNPEDGSEAVDICNNYTDAEEAGRYVRETGVDSLAVAVGNAHGLYKGTPNINMQRLSEIYDAAGIPLVLHGCSGIPDEQIKQAASIAVAKINVNTEIALAGSRRIKELLQQDEKLRLEKLMLGARDTMKEVMEHFLNITE